MLQTNGYFINEVLSQKGSITEDGTPISVLFYDLYNFMDFYVQHSKFLSKFQLVKIHRYFQQLIAKI